MEISRLVSSRLWVDVIIGYAQAQAFIADEVMFPRRAVGSLVRRSARTSPSGSAHFVRGDDGFPGKLSMWRCS